MSRAEPPAGRKSSDRGPPLLPTGSPGDPRGNLADEGAVAKITGVKTITDHRPGACLRLRRGIASRDPRGKITRRRRRGHSGTKVRRADLGCAKCWPRPRRSSGQALGTGRPSSPTADSRAATYGMVVGHVAPEAAVGRTHRPCSGRRSASRSMPKRGCSRSMLPAARLQKSREAWTAPAPRFTRGVLAKYARVVSSRVWAR